MKLTVAIFVLAAILVYGKETKPHRNTDIQHTAAQDKKQPDSAGQTVIIVDQQAPQGQQDDHTHESPSYLHRLFSPENLPTIALVIVGIVGTVVALITLFHIKRQADTLDEHKTKFDELAKAANSNAQASILQVQAMQGQITEMSIQSGLMEAGGKHTERLAQQAVKQSGLTQRQLDLANRPWVCIDSVTPASDLTFRDSGDAVLFFAYQLRNVGHSVAQHLQPWFEPVINGIHDPLEVRDRISAQLKRPVDSAFDHGKLIFPSQTIVDKYPVLIRKEVLEKAIQNSPYKVSDIERMPCIGVELFVCFDYQSTLDSTVHHQTQNMYILTHIGPRDGVFFPSQKVYKVNELRVGYKGYGAYAD
jgi:hypothetical protein